jgi:endonuclease/exonuclease/phosphatase family metal-dependent hydrolase
MKILTFNAWHGLDGKGTLSHGELESPLVRACRLERQVRKLAECAPDLAFLQEVNPLGKRLPQLARALSMEAVSQSDLSGIKIWGKGVPANLSSGLAILAKDELRKLEGLRLSGSRWSFATADFSFQLSETRYALLAELRNSIMGRLLVVNAHLHHGLEPNASLLEKLQRLFDDKVVSAAQRNEIVKLMGGARERRCGEGRRLVDRIEKLAPSYDGVILAGDMNADPESAVIEFLRSHHLVDIVPAGINTWDKAANAHVFQLSESFQLTIPDFGIAPLKDILRTHEARPTRLDYIFMSKNLSKRVQSVSLFGHDMLPEESISDHFGIFATLH